MDPESWSGQPERDRYLERVVTDVEQLLRGARIKPEVSGRPKHYYSIYEKMVRRRWEFLSINEPPRRRPLWLSLTSTAAAA